MTNGITTWGRDLTPGATLDVAVVIPTLLRPSLARAIGSVFGQRFGGTVQVMVGIDRPEGPSRPEALLPKLPPNMALTVLEPGYCTMRAHGGTSEARGGCLRTVLSYLAQAPLVAYLDDDCWWEATHLRSLTDAIRHRDWAFGLRWFVAPGTRMPLGVDRLESVGPERGLYATSYGGFCDTSTLMIDKTRCPEVLPLWSNVLRGHASGRGADRVVFEALRQHASFGSSGQATAYYELQESDEKHALRMKHLRKRLGAMTAFDLFGAGQHLQAGVAFFRHHYLTGSPPFALAWAVAALARAGDRRGVGDIVARHAPAQPDLAWRAFQGEPGEEDVPTDPAAACIVHFFRGQKALVLGDEGLARRRLEQAVATGVTGRPEHAVAATDLARLRRDRSATAARS